MKKMEIIIKMDFIHILLGYFKFFLNQIKHSNSNSLSNLRTYSHINFISQSLSWDTESSHHFSVKSHALAYARSLSLILKFLNSNEKLSPPLSTNSLQTQKSSFKIQKSEPWTGESMQVFSIRIRYFPSILLKEESIQDKL